MAEPLVIVGIGGFGREVADVVEAVNAAAVDPPWHLLGMIDDRPSAVNLGRLNDRQLPFLGGVDAFLACGTPTAYVVGIGSPTVRRDLAARFDAAGLEAATLVHPSATCGSMVSIGAGSVVCPGARLGTNSTLGRHGQVNANATVGHDSVLGDFVSLNPLAAISGDCAIGDSALIGVAGVVLNGLVVGAGSTVGGSACVVRDVAENMVVRGVPAR
ncbi:NeuD/PglB/VioB family sugar acetyltransferase [Nocardioides sp.]|uniref:NeuD/PglB/VioB family sugar acetyltransferase n=1 Tax=Nocardioides sp. TaxID=35761 RepID=UPI003D1088BA